MSEIKFDEKLSKSIEKALKPIQNSRKIEKPYIESLLSNIDIGLDVLLERKKPDKPDSCFLSQAQMDEHYDVHYKGYIDGYKDAKRRLGHVSYSDVAEYRAALLDVSHNYNGILLHEIYFESLGKSDPSEKTTGLINKSFGSHDELEKAMKPALMGSRGWVVLGYSELDDELVITIKDQHDVHGMHICPVLALDVWEHSFYVQYKSNKDRYTSDLIRDINWKVVSKKLDELF